MTRRPLVAVLSGLALCLVALGVWQLRRRDEKLRLIAQTEARLAAPPVAPPGPQRWATIGPADAYTRVVVTGRYLRTSDTRVQAVTALGGGAWVVTPLDTGRFVLLVNRGFVPAEHKGAIPLPAGIVTVRGLLRLSEPGGGFLRANQPAADRWTSRDVAAIATRRQLGGRPVAPYFIDADAGAALPVGGLTIVRFANNHLVYALTWFALAALAAGMAWKASRRCDQRPRETLARSRLSQKE